jgi:type III restriction enzyme
MTAPEPKLYQAKAIEFLSEKISNLLWKDQALDRLAILSAPTGSGKTLVTALTLAAVHSKPQNPGFIVLWFSPGRGGLHKQSADALDTYLANTSMSVTLLESKSDINSNKNPSNGQVFVVNWENLWQIDNDQWVNRMMQPGDEANSFTLLSNASSAGLDMICVIDESHTQLGGENIKKLVDTIRSFRPFIQFEVSATPNRQPEPNLKKLEIQVDYAIPFEEVVNAQMVKKSVQLNADFARVQASYPNESLQIQVLWAAWEKVKALQEAYFIAGSETKPLLLIQYPDGRQADSIAEIVEEFLRERGLVKDRTYATWLSGDRAPNLNQIKWNDSQYQALIFKQAIATGWDCPRAQVLVQFRKPESRTFQIQTLGRLMRSPEQKHYDNEDLNTAYVYSDIADAEVQVTADDPNYIIRDLMLRRGSSYPTHGLYLSSIFQPRRRDYHYPLSSTMEQALFAELEKGIGRRLPKVRPTETLSEILTEGVLDSERILGGKNAFFEGQKRAGTLSDLVVQVLFDELLTSKIGPYSSKEQSRPRIKKNLIRWFKSKDDDWQPDEIQHFCLGKQDLVSSAIEAACIASALMEEQQAVAEARSKRRTNNEWEIPENELIAPIQWEETSDAGNLWEPSYVRNNRSQPEVRFETWLGKETEAGRVLWWWKNGTRDEKYLGIPYEYKDQMTGNPSEEITYPDYLVMSESNVLWCLEVKDIDDMGSEIEGRTHSKAKGLANWAKEMNKPQRLDIINGPCKVEAGVVVPNRKGAIQVKIGDSSQWQIPTQSNWDANKSWRILSL